MFLRTPSGNHNLSFYLCAKKKVKIIDLWKHQWKSPSIIDYVFCIISNRFIHWTTTTTTTQRKLVLVFLEFNIQKELDLFEFGDTIQEQAKFWFVVLWFVIRSFPHIRIDSKEAYWVCSTTNRSTFFILSEKKIILSQREEMQNQEIG